MKNGEPAQLPVYAFARHLCRRLGLSTIVDIGGHNLRFLAELGGEFDVVATTTPDKVQLAAELVPGARWVPIERPRTKPHSDVLAGLDAVAVWCRSDRRKDHGPPLQGLGDLLERCPVVLVSEIDRCRERLATDMPPASNQPLAEGREELLSLANSAGLQVAFSGWTAPGCDGAPRATLLVLSRLPLGLDPPAGFAVKAFMTAFNEADLIRASAEDLLRQGIRVHVLDNWSSDGTREILQDLASDPRLGVERFPPEGPTRYFEWRRMLRRVEELAADSDAHWVVHVDADEFRQSPWANRSLREALWDVDQGGFTAVDHTVLTFPSVDDGFPPGTDPRLHFRHVEFGCNPGHWTQVKAWKQPEGCVSLAASGGHLACFEGVRPYPFNFLSRHYPIRSQEHGERKVSAERQARWAPEERADGWHVQYDSISPGHRFVRDPHSLELFEEGSFVRNHLAACLGRIGICGRDANLQAEARSAGPST